MKQLSQKLDWQQYKPFQIVKKIEKVVYQLKLLKKLCIHNVFHVSLLHDHKSQTDEDISESETLYLAENSEQKEWKIEIITDLWVIMSSEDQSVLQYQIVWKGSSEIIWKPAENVKNVKKLIKKFHQDFSDTLWAIINAETHLWST